MVTLISCLAMPTGLLKLIAKVLLHREALSLELASIRASCRLQVLPSFLDCLRDDHRLTACLWLLRAPAHLLLLSILKKSKSTSLSPYVSMSMYILCIFLLVCYLPRYSPASLSFYIPSFFIKNHQDSGKHKLIIFVLCLTTKMERFSVALHGFLFEDPVKEVWRPLSTLSIIVSAIIFISSGWSKLDKCPFINHFFQ